MRKHYLNNTETGFFKKEKRDQAMPNPMTDPSMLKDAMKGNMMNVLPMIVIGGWINWTFSGFITTKVPFPLTLRLLINTAYDASSASPLSKNSNTA